MESALGCCGCLLSTLKRKVLPWLLGGYLRIDGTDKNGFCIYLLRVFLKLVNPLCVCNFAPPPLDTCPLWGHAGALPAENHYEVANFL